MSPTVYALPYSVGAMGESLDLPGPHSGGRPEPVRQQDCGPKPVHFVVEPHPVAIQDCHLFVLLIASSES